MEYTKPSLTLLGVAERLVLKPEGSSEDPANEESTDLLALGLDEE